MNVNKRISVIHIFLLATALILLSFVIFAYFENGKPEYLNKDGLDGERGENSSLNPIHIDKVDHSLEFRVKTNDRELNLLDEMKRLSSSEHRDDPRSQWKISKIIDYCRAYVSNPAGFSSDTDKLIETARQDYVSSLKLARDRVAGRCRELSENYPAEDFTYLSSMVLKTRAAKQGDLAAQASLLSSQAPISTDSQYIKNLIDDVINSKDPDAYLELSDAMGFQSVGKPEAYGKFSGGEEYTYAWQLAACRLGLDCSKTGDLMTKYCVNGGICMPYSNFEEMLFRGLLPEAERKNVNRISADIINNN
ncbi:hypothetical protein [Pseudoxanthomonas kalamensis]|uniref:hypothetical protein n=1 Tax=Pseudoxanthomonas kalamensis TaxID=289483 RepID=UPI001391B318|nr:hypothetical protein [Pseudoxanthomonas kalamensis]